jgi:hypothetical protein
VTSPQARRGPVSLRHPALRAGLLAFVAAFPVMFAAPLLLRLVALIAYDDGVLAVWALVLGLAGSSTAGAVGAAVGARRALRRDRRAGSVIRRGAAAGAALLVLLLGVLAVVIDPAAVFVNGLAVVAAALAAWWASGRALSRARR